MLFGVDLSKDSPSVRQNGTLDSEKDSLSTMISEQKLLYHVDPLSLGSIASVSLGAVSRQYSPKDSEVMLSSSMRAIPR